jgi:hypothetical protein
VTAGSSGESLRGEARRRGVSVNRVRKERNTARGLSPAASVGHPSRDEPTASALQRVGRGRSSLEDEKLAAIARARVVLADRPKFDADATARRLRRSDDRPTLVRLANASAEEWEQLATVQLPGNPAFYHGSNDR